MKWLFALVVALGVGCAASPPPSRSAAPAPAAEARESVHVATSGTYPPLSAWTGQRPLGFAPELVVAFAASQGAEIRWSRFQWPALAEDLRESRFDIVADGITVRPERSIAGRFTVPIARGGAVLLVRRPSWADSLPRAGDAKQAVAALDRPELRVVVNEGGHLERVARLQLQHASVRALPDNGAVREAFARGDADAAMTNTYEAPRWAEGLSGIERFGPLTSDVTALWVRADRSDLAERLDAWLLAEEESGRLDALRSRTLPAGSPRTATPAHALFAAISERLALMPFVAANKRRTGKPIEDREQEARVLATAKRSVTDAARRQARREPASPEVEAFFRAQIEAAKEIQRSTPPSGAPAAFSLQDDLRPAIARIDARIATLLVRVAERPPTAAEIASTARETLEESGLPDAHVEAIATAVASLK